jgi:chitin disaccharide deacetylase
MSDRFLVVTADDFGIGDETSRGILDLAACGAVTSTVLLVNSPHAESSVRMWRSRGNPVELGWHPCLTLDSPILPATRVPTLVDEAGRFHKLPVFLKKLTRGCLNRTEVEAELHAQYERFRELVGRSATNVNAHHHIHIFGPVREALIRVLAHQSSRPFVRRVVESWRTLSRVPGGRMKRAMLTYWGRRSVSGQHRANLPGNSELIGVTNPECVQDTVFFQKWLRQSVGQFVELTCHPGHWDLSLVGRDGTVEDGQLHRRTAEWKLLSEPAFRETVRSLGFQMVSGYEMVQILSGNSREIRKAA